MLPRFCVFLPPLQNLKNVCLHVQITYFCCKFPCYGVFLAVGLRSFFFFSFFLFFLFLFLAFCLFVCFLTAELAQTMTSDCWSLLEESELSRYGLWRLLEKVIKECEVVEPQVNRTRLLSNAYCHFLLGSQAPSPLVNTPVTQIEAHAYLMALKPMTTLQGVTRQAISLLWT